VQLLKQFYTLKNPFFHLHNWIDYKNIKNKEINFLYKSI